MARAISKPMTIGILVAALIASGALAGCDGSRTGGPAGAGGGTARDASAPGTGGTAGAGGTFASGGSTGPGMGGKASGGAGSGGAGAGGIGAGGIALGGAAGKATGGSGAGGVATGGVDAGGIASGGVGGKATGGSGSGGVGSGGITSLDAGACIGSACPIDARAIDTSANDAPQPACSQLTTQTDCEARGGCHAVFVDPGTCGCASQGCCAHFDRCVDGAQANCTGPALCKMATPFCESPYVLAYTGTCYEGCVRQTTCAPPTCPQTPPTNGATCGSVGYACTYEDCANAGRTQATCTSGTWTIQTAACVAQACAGGGISSTTITCDVGKICVRTTSGGGAYMIQPSCVDNTCGKGPITTDCLPSLPGSCFSSGSVSGVQVNCSLPSSCGQGQGGCA